MEALFTKLQSSRRGIFLVATAATLTFAAGQAVCADTLKLVGTVGSGSASNVDERFTVYAQGRQARLDIDNGASTLFDGDKGTVYVLNPQAKTYYKERLKDWNPLPRASLAQALPVRPAGGSIDVQLDFSQADDTPGNNQRIGGHDTHKLLIDGTIRPEQPMRSQGGRGGFPGGGGPPGGGGDGGGFPGGGGGGGGGGPLLMSLANQTRTEGSLLHTAQFPGGPGGGPEGGGFSGESGRTAHVTGDFWLGSDYGSVDLKGSSMWAQALMSAWGVGPMTNSLASKLQKTNELPWRTDLTTTWTDRSAQTTNGNGSDPDDGITTDPAHAVTFFASLQFAGEVPTDDSIFGVPGDYTQVSPPSAGEDAQA